jgi:hypothetical protein
VVPLPTRCVTGVRTQTQPGMAALWERKARRYRNFEHLEPQFETPSRPARAPTSSPTRPQGRPMSFPVVTGLHFHTRRRRARGGFPACAAPGALAQFGVVYFDDISAHTTSGPLSLPVGDAVTMTDQNGSTLAIPETLNDQAFKVVWD